ncbi:MAG TPA: 4Fe-4S binding protein, partial [Bacteroidales bacterium]|nr:4Fe-4S binding protein [Bacteroidales bacterium]
MQLIEINELACKRCYACVRICPVKAIKVNESGSTPKIVYDRCIGCGSCYTICDTVAITYYSSLKEAMSLLNSDYK